MSGNEDNDNNHTKYKHKLKDLTTAEGKAYGKTLAAMTKLKSRITSSIKHNEDLLAELDKIKDTHPHDGSYMIGQLNMFEAGMQRAVNTVSLLRTSTEEFNDAKEDILALEIGDEYKYELQEKTLKVEAGLLEYREKVSNFYNRALPIINQCNIAPAANITPRRSSENSPFMK